LGVYKCYCATFSPLFISAMSKYHLTRVLRLGNENRILGTSKVGPKFRVTLVKDVQERLKVRVGDIVIFLEETDGKIVLKAVSYEQLLKTMRK